MRRARDRERPLWPYSKRATSLRLEECGNRLSRSCISILPSSIGHMYSYTRTRTATVPPSQTPGWRRAISLFPYTSATRTHRELMTPPRIILVPRISSARYCHRERLMFRRNLSSLSFSLSRTHVYTHSHTHASVFSPVLHSRFPVDRSRKRVDTSPTIEGEIISFRDSRHESVSSASREARATVDSIPTDESLLSQYVVIICDRV